MKQANQRMAACFGAATRGPTMLGRALGSVVVAALVAVATVPAVAQTATRAIGQVTEVWARDDRYAGFHKELADRFQDTPAADVFMKNEQWVSVLVSTSAVMPVILKARTAPGVKLDLGDIVELTVADNLSVSSYAATSAVGRVICSRAAGAEFSECRSKAEIGMWAGDGKKVTVQRK